MIEKIEIDILILKIKKTSNNKQRRIKKSIILLQQNTLLNVFVEKLIFDSISARDK